MNVDWLSELPAPLRRALYFGSQRMLGSNVGTHWREFLAWEKYSPEQLREAVEVRLGRLLETATTRSEYYRRMKLERQPGQTAVQWLQRFPILQRGDIRAHFNQIVVDRLRNEVTSADSVSKNRYDWLVVKTGGTTGDPTTVVHDANARDWGRCTRLYCAKQCGFPLGMPYFRLWGSEQDLLNQELTLQQRVLRSLHAEIPMNAFRAREADLLRHLEAMRNHPEIHHMMAYVDAAASLAMFIEERKLSAPRLKTIMACAGTVTKEYRELLERIFAAEVFDKYGSRECSDMACECGSHSGLHVLSPHVFVEIVDAEGRACAPGMIGRIVVTALNNLSFPMVRYEVGDLGVWADAAPCACGSAFPRLQSIQGRQDDMLTTEDGTLQSSVFVRHFVGVSLNRQLIRQWQLEQTDARQFVFRYVASNETGLAENLKLLKSSFLTVFGSSSNIEMVRVDEIPPAPTGKTRWIINNYRRR